MSDLGYGPDGKPFDLDDIIDSMPEGGALEVMDFEGLVVVEKQSLRELARKLNSDESQLHFLCLYSRLGIRLFMSRLEYEFYHPEVPGRNDLFQMRWLRWQGLLWTLVSIPAEDMENAIAACEGSGTRIEDGIPVMIIPDGQDIVFPIHNCRSIVNVPDHPMYKNDRGLYQDMKAMEQYQLHQYLVSKGIVSD